MKKTISTLFLITILALSVPASAYLQPAIMINGKVGEVAVYNGNPYQIEISLETDSTKEYEGWLTCYNAGNFYSFDNESNSWKEGIKPFYQGKITSFESIKVSNDGLEIDKGATFIFGYDCWMNGKINCFFGKYSWVRVVFKNDCAVPNFSQTKDFGYIGEFDIVIDYSNLPAGEKHLMGQSRPNGPWIEYEVIPVEGNYGKIVMDWPNGEAFEFSYYVKSQGKNYWIDPSCSTYKFPESAPTNQQHLKLVLGSKKTCSKTSIEDALVKAVEKISTDKYRIYLDFSVLPIENYKKLFVKGQSAPDNIWIEYAITDEFPCFYFDLSWPHDGGIFEFSFGVVREDGQEEWIDPTKSNFIFKDHLGFNPEQPL